MSRITASQFKRIIALIKKELSAELDELMSVKQAAAYLGCTETALRKRCSYTDVPRHKKDGVLYFSKIELNQYYLSKK